MPILRHLHLPNLTTYAHASRLQEILVSRLLRHKAELSKKTLPSSISQSIQEQSIPLPPPPPPTVLTFTPYPIYTTGRRETKPPSATQLAFLKQPLNTEYGVQTADFAQALRGGQITFHGPGQLVVYPILSLARPYSFSSSPLPAPPPPPSSSTSCTNTTSRSSTSLSPRCYVSLLESTTISTLARFGIRGERTENPGVWVGDDTKIAALGVHLRRNVTSHGVGLNVGTDLRWFKRIVACGLEGKGVTSIQEELSRRERERVLSLDPGETDTVDSDLAVKHVANVWVDAFARECGVEEGDVLTVTEEDILAEADEVRV